MKNKFISSQTFEQIARQVRSDFCPNFLGEIDIYAIAYGLGCKIEVVDFDIEEVSARVKRDESSSGRYIIELSRKDGERRRRFSVAHEISHILLHDKEGGGEFVECRRPIIDYSPEDFYKETQANMLASALLLPGDQIIYVWEEIKDVDAVADFFNVSKEALCNRLINLGLLCDE